MPGEILRALDGQKDRKRRGHKNGSRREQPEPVSQRHALEIGGCRPHEQRDGQRREHGDQAEPAKNALALHEQVQDQQDQGGHDQHDLRQDRK